jgi:tetratricopeptide (TPR) repeat protein
MHLARLLDYGIEALAVVIGLVSVGTVTLFMFLFTKEILVWFVREVYNKLRVLYYKRRLRLARDSGNTKEWAALLRNIARIYDDEGELDKALSYYEKSLNLTTNEKEKAATYNIIALIYNKKHDYQKAVEYFHKAIETSERYGDYHDASISKLNLGEIYRKMEDYENAEKYLSEGIEGAKKVGDKYWEARGYQCLAWLYIYKGIHKGINEGDKKMAKENFKHAYNLYESIGAEEDARDVLRGMYFLDKLY